jgi:hypothetical protein
MDFRKHGCAWKVALAAVLLPVGVLGLGARRHAPAGRGAGAASGTVCALPPALVSASPEAPTCTNPNLAKGDDSMTSTHVGSPGALPLLDREVPARTEVATFALG